MSNSTKPPPGALQRAAEWLRGSGPTPALGVGNPNGTVSRGQLNRLSGVIENAAMRADNAKRCHDDARRHIDSALYELDQLRAELGAIVDPKLIARPTEPPAAAATPKAEPAEPAARAEPKAEPKAGLGRSIQSAA